MWSAGNVSGTYLWVVATVLPAWLVLRVSAITAAWQAPCQAVLQQGKVTDEIKGPAL